jgi:hypothetical protein
MMRSLELRTKSEQYRKFIQFIAHLKTTPLSLEPSACIECWQIVGEVERVHHVTMGHSVTVPFWRMEAQILDFEDFKRFASECGHKKAKLTFDSFGIS